jgi:starch phosphorylase
VELYADGISGNAPVRREMMRGRPLPSAPGGWLYGTRVPADRPASDYTARVIPQHPGVAIPLEEARVTWQR